MFVTEETLKLILEKINSMDSKINSMDSKMAAMDSKINSMDSKMATMDSKINSMDAEIKEVKSIQLRMENTMNEKFGALFDAREVLIDADKHIEDKVDKIQQDISDIRKVTIKNAADIIDLQEYRKQN